MAGLRVQLLHFSHLFSHIIRHLMQNSCEKMALLLCVHFVTILCLLSGKGKYLLCICVLLLYFNSEKTVK